MDVKRLLSALNLNFYTASVKQAEPCLYIFPHRLTSRPKLAFSTIFKEQTQGESLWAERSWKGFGLVQHFRWIGNSTKKQSGMSLLQHSAEKSWKAPKLAWILRDFLQSTCLLNWKWLKHVQPTCVTSAYVCTCMLVNLAAKRSVSD